MQMSLLVGFLLVLAAGLLQGTFILPMTPVSYTHLDVYKRQIGKRKVGRGDWCEQPGFH